MPHSPAPSPCSLYLVRHGATDNNRADPPLLQGRRTDPGLSAEGRSQAERTAKWLSTQPVAKVYSSPLLRARQTAEAIAAAHHLPIELVEDLVEVDVGLWESRSWDEIERTDPEAYRLFRLDASVNPYLGGENLDSVAARVVPAMQRIMEQNAGRTVVVVAHNGVNRVYLAHLLGAPLARYRSIPQDNCGLTLLRHEQAGAKLVTINAIAHLT